MSKERYNRIIDEVYWIYLIEDAKILPNMPKEKMTEIGLRLTKEELINKIKIDKSFSDKWGLKIEEQKLSWEERRGWCKKNKVVLEHFEAGLENEEDDMRANRVPTKLITLTYKDEQIKFYE